MVSAKIACAPRSLIDSRRRPGIVASHTHNVTASRVRLTARREGLLNPTERAIALQRHSIEPSADKIVHTAVTQPSQRVKEQPWHQDDVMMTSINWKLE